MESNGSAALAVVEPSNSLDANVGVLMRRATDVAGVCREIVMKTAQAIQGRKYVRVEGWQAIAVAYGCVASARDVEEIPGGVRAIGEVRRMSDGAVVATAEGYVGSDETTWYGGVDARGKKHEPRPKFAIRAMAQTRAISRACRSAFSFVVTLIDGNLSTTPFEEADGLIVDGTIEPPAPTGVAGLKAKLAPPSPPKANASPPRAVASQPPSNGATPTHDRSMSFVFGRDKGVALKDLEEGSLKWFESALLRDLDDASKSKWHEKTRQQLTTLRAELAWRGL